MTFLQDIYNLLSLTDNFSEAFSNAFSWNQKTLWEGNKTHNYPFPCRVTKVVKINYNIFFSMLCSLHFLLLCSSAIKILWIFSPQFRIWKIPVNRNAAPVEIVLSTLHCLIELIRNYSTTVYKKYEKTSNPIIYPILTNHFQPHAIHDFGEFLFAVTPSENYQ